MQASGGGGAVVTIRPFIAPVDAYNDGCTDPLRYDAIASLPIAGIVVGEVQKIQAMICRIKETGDKQLVEDLALPVVSVV